MFTKYSVKDLKANQEKTHYFLSNSLMLVTALNPVIGYDKAAALAKKAHKEGTTLKEACVALGYLTAVEFDKAVQPEKMTKPTL